MATAIGAFTSREDSRVGGKSSIHEGLYDIHFSFGAYGSLMSKSPAMLMGSLLSTFNKPFNILLNSSMERIEPMFLKYV